MSRRRFKPLWRRIRFALLRAVLTPLSFLPRRIGLSLFGALGAGAYCLLGKARAMTLENTQRVFPAWSPAEHRAFGARVFRNLGRNGFDFIRLPRYSEAEIRELMTIEGREHLERARRPGKGIICLSAHLGCWELISYRLRLEGHELAVVYRRLRSAELDAYVAERRSRFGIATHDRDTGARGLVRSLRRGAIVGILIDQATRVDSVRVPFMGHPAWTPCGATRMAMRMGLPIVPTVAAMCPDGRHRLIIGPEIELRSAPGAATDEEFAACVAENTARCNAVLEKLILASKEQWVWFHPRWRER